MTAKLTTEDVDSLDAALEDIEAALAQLLPVLRGESKRQRREHLTLIPGEENDEGGEAS